MERAGHHEPHENGHPHRHFHGHSHGVAAPSIASTERGLWALKWSFAGLLLTAAIQLVVVILFYINIFFDFLVIQKFIF
jgi:hypothetical protein